MASDPHQISLVGPPAQSYQRQSNAWSAPHAQQPSSVEQYPNTSRTFSSAPEEDWTKISDLAERRKIQNRIAQRKYRKKIKERMQFLENKAGGDDAKGIKKSLKPNRTKRQQQKQSQHHRRSSSPSMSSSASLAAPVALHHPRTPPMKPEDQSFFSSTSPPGSNPPPFSAYQQSYCPPPNNGFYPQHSATMWMGPRAFTATTTAPTLPMPNFSEAYNKGNEYSVDVVSIEMTDTPYQTL